jgi:hypothetical protein
MRTRRDQQRHKAAQCAVLLAFTLACDASVLSPSSNQVAFADMPLVGICHIGDIGNYSYIRVTPIVAQSHLAHGDRPAPCLIDFEQPTVNLRQVIDPYGYAGVIFTAEPAYGLFPGVVGLIWNSATSVCDPGRPGNQQLLGTGNVGSFGVNPIRATFHRPIPAGATVSVLAQTGSGAAVNLRLFGWNGAELAFATALAVPSDRQCAGFPNAFPAQVEITARAVSEVAYVVIASDPPAYVLAIDNFRFGDR